MNALCVRVAPNTCGSVATFSFFFVLMQLFWVELGSTPVRGSRAALVVVHDSQPCLRAPLLCLCAGKLKTRINTWFFNASIEKRVNTYCC